MNIIAVDDERLILEGMKSLIEETLPGNALSCFNTPKSALEYARNNQVDLAFLDIEMGGMNGLQLAKRLKDTYGKTIIIFITGYAQYAMDAFNVHASGYLLKPVTKKALRETTENLLYPAGETAAKVPEKKLRVQTFGNFEVFADGKPLSFARTKTRELFAYLVSRKGALCSNNEIAAVLWENKEDSPALQSSLRQLVMDLTQALNEAEIHDVLMKKRGALAVVTDKISCDFYDFCAGINVNSYMGEFMNQYGWAEFTNAYLDKMQAAQGGGDSI